MLKNKKASLPTSYYLVVNIQHYVEVELKNIAFVKSSNDKLYKSIDDFAFFLNSTLSLEP